jgi:hypothetical protein
MQILPTLVLITSALSYRRCDRERYPFAGQNVTVPIMTTATQVIQVNNVSVPVTVGGSIRVVDGCTFEVLNFTLSGSFTGAWFGGNGTDVNGYRLSSRPVASSQAPSTTRYEFIMNAGSWVSYFDFTQFRLFEVNSNAVIATADLPARPTTGSNNSPTGSGSGEAPATTSGAERVLASLWFLMLFV